MLVALARLRLLSDGRRQHGGRTDRGVPRPDGRRDPRHLRDAARRHRLVGAGPGPQRRLEDQRLSGERPRDCRARPRRGRGVVHDAGRAGTRLRRVLVRRRADLQRAGPRRRCGIDGRVQVELLADGSAAVSWIEFGKGPSQLKVRTVERQRDAGPAGGHRRSDSARSSPAWPPRKTSSSSRGPRIRAASTRIYTARAKLHDVMNIFAGTSRAPFWPLSACGGGGNRAAAVQAGCRHRRC